MIRRRDFCRFAVGTASQGARRAAQIRIRRLVPGRGEGVSGFPDSSLWPASRPGRPSPSPPVAVPSGCRPRPCRAGVRCAHLPHPCAVASPPSGRATWDAPSPLGIPCTGGATGVGSPEGRGLAGGADAGPVVGGRGGRRPSALPGEGVSPCCPWDSRPLPSRARLPVRGSPAGVTIAPALSRRDTTLWRRSGRATGGASVASWAFYSCYGAPRERCILRV